MDKILVDSNCELLDLKQLSPNNCQRNMSGFGQVARLSSLKGLVRKRPLKNRLCHTLSFFFLQNFYHFMQLLRIERYVVDLYIFTLS